MKLYTLFVVLLSALACLSALDIHSTAAGGSWNQTATWVEGQVPGPDDNVWINGPVKVTNNSQCHDLYISEGCQLRNEEMYRTLYIGGDLSNHGSIANPSHYLTIYLYGNLFDHGQIGNMYFYIQGAGTHTLWQSTEAGPISCPNFYAAADSDLQLLSDLSFAACNLSLNNTNLIMHHQGDGFGISLNGGYLGAANLEGGSGASLSLDGGASVNNLNIDEIVFQGVVQLSTNVVVERLVNLGIMQNDGGYRRAWVNEKLENHGSIRNKPGANLLYLTLRGDLFDQGLIDNNEIAWEGTNQHQLWQSETASPIGCDNILAAADCGSFQLLSDLSFAGSAIFLNGRTVIMHQGRDCHDLYLEGGSINSASLDTNGFSVVEGANNPILANIQGEDIIVRGSIWVSNSCQFDNLVNEGILSNSPSAAHGLFVQEKLINRGTISNGPGNYLSVYCHGDLANYGTLSNSYFYIQSDQDQYLLMADGSSESCVAFYLVSDVGVAWWAYNGYFYDDYAMENRDTDTNSFGVWQAVVYEPYQAGRYITIGNGAPVSPPQNLVILRGVNQLRLQWNEVDNATFYNIYAASDPGGEYLLLPEKAYDNDPGDGIVFWEFPAEESFRFFKVSAAN